MLQGAYVDPSAGKVTVAEWACQWSMGLAHLKATRRLDGRHGTTVPGVRQALRAGPRVHPLGRRVRGRAAPLQHIAVEQSSGLEALRGLSAPQTGMPRVALCVHPARPPRGEPRVKKRRPKPVPLRSTPRQERPRPLVQQALSR